MPLKSGAVIENSNLKGRANLGLITLQSGVTTAYPYLGCYVTTPAKIVKLESKSLEKVTTLTLPQIGGADPRGVTTNMLLIGTKLYFGTYTINGGLNHLYLVRVDTEDMTFEDSLELTPALSTVLNENALSLAYIAPYIYVATGYDPNARLFKVDRTAWSISTQRNLTNNGFFSSLIYHSGTGKLYGFFMNPNHALPGIVREFSPVDLSTTGTLTLQAGDEDLYYGETDGTFIYTSAPYGTAGSRIIKINPATMTRVSSVTLSVATEGDIYMRYVAPYLYISRSSGTGRIYKVDPSTMTLTSTLDLLAGETACSELSYKKPYLYVVLYIDPANCIKIKVADFTRVEAIDPPLTVFVERYANRITVG